MEGKNRLMDLLGDYRPEVQPGPNAGMQQEMMQRQPQDRERVVQIAQRLQAAGDMEAASALLAAAGFGAMAGAFAAPNPASPALMAGGLGAASLGMAGQKSAARDQVELYGEQGAAYPGIYGSR